MIASSPFSRRRFIAGAAALWPLASFAQPQPADGRILFRHGVASGDPLHDRVVLWTRVTPPPTRSATGPIEVRWQIASDEGLTQIVASGMTQAAPDRDFTVKVDAGSLEPARTYYFAFEAGGERSAIGRTKTTPATRAGRIRLAIVSCSNYPMGYFNVYRCVANRGDLDAVIHLGDYLYETASGPYGGAMANGRARHPAGEAITLDEYRRLYAVYRSDPDLQEAHRLHPFIAVWDDHEIANNSWSGGAARHTREKGAWAVRVESAFRAYREWMPVRETNAPARLYRTIRFGPLADLILLDTRSGRDRQVAAADLERLADPSRSLLGAAQEAWMFDELRSSSSRGTTWRLLGQQVMFGHVTPPGVPVQNVDAWDGYPAARRRVLEFLARERIPDVAVLTGDIHSSWAMDLPLDPWSGYDGRTGTGSLAVELITPAISSAPLFTIQGVRERAPFLRLANPTIKYLEGDSRGYMLMEVTPQRIEAGWHFVRTVSQPSVDERPGATLVCERGSSRLAAG